VFDFNMLKAFVSRPDFTMVFDAMHAVTGAAAGGGGVGGGGWTKVPGTVWLCCGIDKLLWPLSAGLTSPVFLMPCTQSLVRGGGSAGGGGCL
jgi:hypothetical protein